MTFVRLLVVEQTFHLASRDALLLAPSLDVDRARDADVALTLRFADGRKRDVTGRIARTHLSFRDAAAAHGPSFVATVLLRGVSPAEVPPGTEVWALAEEGGSPVV